ncbi:MAG: N-6 DNA methylase, partial [Bacteroidota bacterium]
MANSIKIEPFLDELPSQFADRLGIHYTSLVDKEHKKENGQYFTPAEIAELMGTYAECNLDIIKILDPGCGTTILSCSLIEKLSTGNSNLKTIELSAYETDLELNPYSIKSLNY